MKCTRNDAVWFLRLKQKRRCSSCLVHGDTCFWGPGLPCKTVSPLEAATLGGSPGHMERRVEVLWLTAPAAISGCSQQPHQTWVKVPEDGSGPQAPSHLQPSGLPGGGPRHAGVEASHLFCALSRFLTRKSCEHNKMVTALFHSIWFGLWSSNSNWKKAFFLLALRIYTISTSYFFPFRMLFQFLCYT